MNILILAGGLGSRFFANSSKITTNFWGISVLEMLTKNALKVSKNVYVVLRKDHKINNLDHQIKIIIQKNEYGTAAAAQSYLDEVKDNNDLLIIPGDVPLIESDIMSQFKEQAFLADILVGVMPVPEGFERYGRIIVKNGEIVQILEYSEHPEKTQYVNTGILYLSKRVQHLVSLIQINDRNEKYLTKIVELAIKNNFKIKPIELKHEDALGFNTIDEFNNIVQIAQTKWRKRALKSQAIFFDINSVCLSYDTEFELGATIEPFCRFLPGVKIGKNGLIKAFSSLENCYINGIVGPFANIRSGKIENNAEIGAFVEMNRSIVQQNSKIKHLTYLGDAEIGKNVNIGAGCVICNYDGKKKHKTYIKDNSFIGSNTTIIAPITIEKEAFLAAGGVFNKDIGEKEFSIARTKQENKKRKDL